MHLHFLRAIGIAMSMRAGIAADSAAALLFRVLSQPALLFPPLRQIEEIEILGGDTSCNKKQVHPSVMIVEFIYVLVLSVDFFFYLDIYVWRM